MTALLLALSVTFTPAHDAFGPNVSHARAWLRERTTVHAFRCAHVLWMRESHWHVHATNRYSGAFGIPQSLPGSKMAAAERPRRGRRWDDWRHDALVQVAWGTHYVRGRYGGFCAALRFQTRSGWY